MEESMLQVVDGNLQFLTDYSLGIFTVASEAKAIYEIYPEYVVYAAIFESPLGEDYATLTLECGEYYEGEPAFIKTWNKFSRL